MGPLVVVIDGTRHCRHWVARVDPMLALSNVRASSELTQKGQVDIENRASHISKRSVVPRAELDLRIRTSAHRSVTDCDDRSEFWVHTLSDYRDVCAPMLAILERSAHGLGLLCECCVQPPSAVRAWARCTVASNARKWQVAVTASNSRASNSRLSPTGTALPAICPRCPRYIEHIRCMRGSCTGHRGIRCPPVHQCALIESNSIRTWRDGVGTG